MENFIRTERSMKSKLAGRLANAEAAVKVTERRVLHSSEHRQFVLSLTRCGQYRVSTSTFVPRPPFGGRMEQSRRAFEDPRCRSLFRASFLRYFPYVLSIPEPSVLKCFVRHG